MPREITIKCDDFCKCTYHNGTGYIIRMLKYSGATFSIGADGSIAVGQSQRFKYRLEDWKRLEQEIHIGMEFMTRVAVFGYDPYKDAKRVEKITPSKYKVGGYYRDSSGRGILYMGRVKGLDFFRNRSGCPYGVALFDSYTDLLEVARLKDNVFGKTFGMKFKLNCDPEVDTRAGKPTNILEELQVIPDFSGRVTIFDIATKRELFRGVVDIT